MTRPALDHAVLSSRLAQIAQLMETYDSKTDQTAQTDQRIEIAEEFGTPLALQLTSPHPKLTSGTAQRWSPLVQAVDIPIDSSRARPIHGAPP